MGKLVKNVAIILILYASSFAQSKTAILDSNAFYDEKLGIKILTEAVKMTYDCDFISPSFRKKIKKIAKLKNEISSLKSQGKSTDEKVLELLKIEEKFNFYRKSRDEAYKKMLFNFNGTN